VLINFSVENFRSFGAEQTLNLIASGKLQGHDDHQIPIGDTGKSVLRTGVVYGANAAGKSNLVRAILFAQSLIMGTGQTRLIALNQFRFRKEKNRRLLSFGFWLMKKFGGVLLALPSVQLHSTMIAAARQLFLRPWTGLMPHGRPEKLLLPEPRLS